MSDLTNDLPAERQDDQYLEGLGHLQSGAWDEAIRCFEESAERYGDSPALQREIERARFGADLDGAAQIKPQRIVFPWRPILVRALTILAIGVIVWQAIGVVQRQIAPALAQAQEQRALASLLARGNAYLEAENLDSAEEMYHQLLTAEPGHEGAQAGLKQVAAMREILALYEQGVAQQEADDLIGALETFTQLSFRAAGYRDVSLRITEIKRLLSLDRLFIEAEADYEGGRYADAKVKYSQIKGLNTSYRREQISERLFDIHMRQGQELIESDPPQPDMVSLALEEFTQALALKPRDVQGITEQRLASLWISGQAAYDGRAWAEAVARLGAVYDQRPDYLGGTLVSPLYTSYVQYGDQLRDAEDYYYAWDQYHRASELPVRDNTLALGRLDAVRPMLTPTPTPTVTPSPTTYVYVPPTPMPSATPPAPLATYRDQIVFFSDKEDQPGLWIMNPDGSNRRYLGESKQLIEEYETLTEQDRLSPDGRYRVYVTESKDDENPQLYIQGQVDQYGTAETWQVTHLIKVAYDPVWAPDGSRIAFVTQDHGSDDIWVIDPDGSNAWNYTPNKWEWDKRPSWSPDSTRLVFWSNREGTSQIFMIDANGRNVHKVSATTWDEYDPLWIK